MTEEDHLKRGLTEYYFVIGGRYVPLQSTAVTLVLLALSAAMFGQPARWHKTPAYGNLLHIANTYAWGTAYLVAGILMLLAVFVVRRSLALSIVAHTFAVALFVIWEVAFIIRWATDAATTAANAISWGVYLFLAIRSAILFEHPVLSPPPTSETSE